MPRDPRLDIWNILHDGEITLPPKMLLTALLFL
jgi:hypothetical protein